MWLLPCTAVVSSGCSSPRAGPALVVANRTAQASAERPTVPTCRVERSVEPQVKLAWDIHWARLPTSEPRQDRACVGTRALENRGTGEHFTSRTRAVVTRRGACACELLEE